MHLIDAMRDHGLALEFLFALMSQAGLPVPAEPALVIAGALAASGEWRPEVAWIVAASAALIADHAWYLAGRYRGRSLLGLVCRISLSPDTCVRSADGLLQRFGGGLLVLAKLIPGVAAVAIPTAAASGMTYGRFLLYDGIGAAAWSGLWVGVGVIFGREIDRVLDRMEAAGSRIGWILALLVAAWIVAKALQRWRLKRLFRATRIDADEVRRRLADGDPLVIIDARSRLALQDDPRRLPDSQSWETLEGQRDLGSRFRGSLVVTFCTCPNEASAAVVAQRLIVAGHRDVRVLAGGTLALDVLGVEGSEE